MEQELNKAIGTIEPERKESLKPKKVIIESVGFRETKKGRIVRCSVKHPDKEDTIDISSIDYLRDKQVVNSGLWETLDKDGNIQKGCALAVFMMRNGANTIADLKGKEVETELDEKDWLCFKAY